MITIDRTKSSEKTFALGRKMAMLKSLIQETNDLFLSAMEDTRDLLSQIDEEDRDAEDGQGGSPGQPAREEGSRNEGSR